MLFLEYPSIGTGIMREVFCSWGRIKGEGGKQGFGSLRFVTILKTALESWPLPCLFSSVFSSTLSRLLAIGLTFGIIGCKVSLSFALLFLTA
jgi:hypothetical protein